VKWTGGDNVQNLINVSNKRILKEEGNTTKVLKNKLPYYQLILTNAVA
jgi:hypothetical protein